MFRHPVPVLVGAVLGPSVGSLYAKDPRRARRGILIRGAGTTLIIAGHRAGAGALHEGEGHGGQRLMRAGALLVLGSAAYDIALASARSARDYNNRRHEGPPSVPVAPWVGDGAGRLGSQVAVRW